LELAMEFFRRRPRADEPDPRDGGENGRVAGRRRQRRLPGGRKERP
jgi:hypothetical protein